jgi:hypothetical protein
MKLTERPETQAEPASNTNGNNTQRHFAMEETREPSLAATR